MGTVNLNSRQLLINTVVELTALHSECSDVGKPRYTFSFAGLRMPIGYQKNYKIPCVKKLFRPFSLANLNSSLVLD